MSEQQRSFVMSTFIAVLILNGILLGLGFYFAGEAISPLLLFGGGGALSLILWLVVVFIGNRAIADAVKNVPQPQRIETPAVREVQRHVEPRSEPKPEPKPVPPPPSDAAAIQILSILQRKGRLIDFLQEDLTNYDDAQIGAAVRNIHAGCKEAIQEHMTLEPIYGQSEGSQVTVEPGFNANHVRLVGNVTGEPPFSGTLVHRGWRVATIDLPTQTNDKEKVIAPAEVEVG